MEGKEKNDRKKKSLIIQKEKRREKRGLGPIA
jgi:hypothetical protein